jgi:IPT/TIG domain
MNAPARARVQHLARVAGATSLVLLAAVAPASARVPSRLAPIPPPVGTPTITEVAPNKGAEAGGTLVTIKGTNLAEATAVEFGTGKAKIETDTAEAITALSPAGTAGTVDVTVTTAGGTSEKVAADHFTYVAPPTVTEVTPAKGPEAGKTLVTIKGTNLAEATAVEFGSGKAGKIETDTAESITVASPAESAGTVDVTVTTAGGTSELVTADHFTYVALPTVTEVAPNKGPEAGKTIVTIKGTNLAEATVVKFGSKSAKVESDTAESITVSTPVETAGTVDVTVTTKFGGTSEKVAADHFTYVAPPAVTEVTPSAGPEAGKTLVTITGTSLGEATAVEFGAGKPGTIEADSAESIKVLAPVETAGTVDVTVTTKLGGTSEKVAADHFTYVAPPAVTAVEPAAGPEAGKSIVTIKGANLAEATAVEFGAGKPANIESDTPEAITVVLPAGSAGTVDVTVTTPGGASEATSADHFTYFAPPAVTAVKPAEGPEAGGTSVTITGANLAGATAVRFGAAAATSVKVEAEGTIVATSPPGAGKVDVTVTTPGGTSATSAADAFTYLVPVKPPPPPPPAACTMKPIFLTIERKHHGKAKPKITAGQLQVTVTCDQTASVKLAGRLSMHVGKKPTHGKQKMKVYILGPSAASVAKSVASVVTLKLPLRALTALAAKVKESVRITLDATDPGGASHNSVTIKKLRV